MPLINLIVADITVIRPVVQELQENGGIRRLTV
jgi:hypothetical protein